MERGINVYYYRHCMLMYIVLSHYNHETNIVF